MCARSYGFQPFFIIKPLTAGPRGAAQAAMVPGDVIETQGCLPSKFSIFAGKFTNPGAPTSMLALPLLCYIAL